MDRHDETAWARALEELLPAIHEIDRNATRVWFAFFPLALACALRRSDDPDALARKFLLQGEYRLEDQIDLSHTFLYGHRFWPHLRTSDNAWTVTWNENDPTARFKMLHRQEVASACG